MIGVEGTLGPPAGRRAALEIPEATIARLPVYHRQLASMQAQGRVTVSSRQLGEALGLPPAMIRKDLAYFGRFGTQGRGYPVRLLADELRLILGLDRRWTLVLAGVGRLGSAIADYRGLSEQGFDIVALYDAAPSAIGTRVGGHTVRDVRRMESDLRGAAPDIGLIAVPAESAQCVADALVRAGVRALINYAPHPVEVPAGVQLRHIDLAVQLQSITYHFSRGRGAAPHLGEPAAVSHPAVQRKNGVGEPSPPELAEIK